MVKYGINLLDPLKYNLMNTTFNIIQMVIDEAVEVNIDDFQKFLVTWLQAATMYGIAWGIGGILNDESRKKFDQFHKKVCVTFPKQRVKAHTFIVRYCIQALS